MNEKYKKYIKNIPFVELIYNFNFARKQNKEFHEKVKPMIAVANENQLKNIKRNLLLLNSIMWIVNIVMPLIMFFSGFFGFLILHNLEIYLVLLSLIISYYTLSISKDISKEKREQNGEDINLSIMKIEGATSMTIWNYTYLSIGILMAILI